MTRKKAIQLLKEKRTLTTNMLFPLGISFDTFLQFSQLDKNKTQKSVDWLVEHYEKYPTKIDSVFFVHVKHTAILNIRFNRNPW